MKFQMTNNKTQITPTIRRQGDKGKQRHGDREERDGRDN